MNFLDNDLLHMIFEQIETPETKNLILVSKRFKDIMFNELYFRKLAEMKQNTGIKLDWCNDHRCCSGKRVLMEMFNTKDKKFDRFMINPQSITKLKKEGDSTHFNVKIDETDQYSGSLFIDFINNFMLHTGCKYLKEESKINKLDEFDDYGYSKLKSYNLPLKFYTGINAPTRNIDFNKPIKYLICRLRNHYMGNCYVFDKIKSIGVIIEIVDAIYEKEQPKIIKTPTPKFKLEPQMTIKLKFDVKPTRTVYNKMPDDPFID